MHRRERGGTKEVKTHRSPSVSLGSKDPVELLGSHCFRDSDSGDSSYLEAHHTGTSQPSSITNATPESREGLERGPAKWGTACTTMRPSYDDLPVHRPPKFFSEFSLHEPRSHQEELMHLEAYNPLLSCRTLIRLLPVRWGTQNGACTLPAFETSDPLLMW